MNTYRIQIIITASLLCALAGSLVLVPLNLIVSFLGLQEVIQRKSVEGKRNKSVLGIMVFLAVTLLVITFFMLMLSYIDILFALM